MNKSGDSGSNSNKIANQDGDDDEADDDDDSPKQWTATAASLELPVPHLQCKARLHGLRRSSGRRCVSSFEVLSRCKPKRPAASSN